MKTISIDYVLVGMAGYLQDLFWGDGDGPEIDYDEWEWLINRSGSEISVPLVEVDPRIILKKARVETPLAPAIADEYASRLEDGEIPPPILLEGDQLIDGIHRCFAAIEVGNKTIKAAQIRDEDHGRAIGLKLLGKLSQ